MTAPNLSFFERRIGSVDRHMQEFVHQVNDMADAAPLLLTPLVEPVRVSLNTLTATHNSFVNHVRDVWAKTGNSDRLDDVAGRWAQQVGATISRIAGEIAPDVLTTHQEWTGPAAMEYTLKAGRQREELNALHDLAAQLQETLSDLSNATQKFRLAIEFVLAEYAAGIVGALASAATIVGAPVAIGILAATVQASIATVGVALSALMDLIDSIESKQTAIEMSLADIGTTWVEVDTGILADAGVADRDRAEWQRWPR